MTERKYKVSLDINLTDRTVSGEINTCTDVELKLIEGLKKIGFNVDAIAVSKDKS